MEAAQKTKTISETADYLAELVGEEALQGQRMQAGAILYLMDIVAARVAVKHSGSNVATVAIDEVDLKHPIFHMDLVRLEGKLVLVGNSSMVVRVEAFRQEIQSRSFYAVQTSYVTLVAILSNGRPNKNIPRLIYQNKEEEELRDQVLLRRELTNKWQQAQKDVDLKGQLTVEDVEDARNRVKKEFLTIEETTLIFRRVFFPKHLNINNTIFGGDILQWMDSAATQCARTFTRNRNMTGVLMNRVSFKQPVYTTDWVEMRARVVYVRKYVLEVEIEVEIERASGERIISHSGYFLVLNFNEAGIKREILTGLKLSEDDQTSLKAYMKAKQRYAFGNGDAVTIQSNK